MSQFKELNPPPRWLPPLAFVVIAAISFALVMTAAACFGDDFATPSTVVDNVWIIDGKLVRVSPLIEAAKLPDGTHEIIGYSETAEPVRVTVTISRGVRPLPIPPGPGPIPPEPTPGPIPPASDLWAIVIEESAERTLEQTAVLGSAKVRGLFPADHFRIIDDDEVPDAYRGYAARAAGKKLPQLFVANGKGVIYFEGELPATIEAATTKLKQVLGVK